MMEEKISVVVCTYNQQSTIGRTLDSILAQRCHVPMEVVIGDDHSTDATLTVCRQYAARHPDIVRIVEQASNRGLQNNYFDCLLETRGRYIADCAGDDFWTDPLKLEKQVTVLQQHPEVSMVLTRWNRYDEATGLTTPGALPPFREAVVDGRKALLPIVTQTDMSVFHLCTSLYRADVFRKAYDADPELFRNSDFGVEDTQVAFVMALGGSIAYLPDVTLNYSTGHLSASCQCDDSRQYRFVLGITKMAYYIVTRYHLQCTETDRLFSRRLLALAMHAFRAHSPSLAQQTATLRQQWGVRPSLCFSIVLAVMRHEQLWRLSLRLRRLVVALKRALANKQ